MAFVSQGTAVSIIQVVALVLLTVGVYPYRIRTKNRNLITHGFLSITALALNLATVFFVMIPTLSSNIAQLNSFSILQKTIVWLHVSLGAAAIILGLTIIISWIAHPLAELSCSKTWRLMIPTFVIWAIALAIGIIIQVYNII